MLPFESALTHRSRRLRQWIHTAEWKWPRWRESGSSSLCAASMDSPGAPSFAGVKASGIRLLWREPMSDVHRRWGPREIKPSG